MPAFALFFPVEVAVGATAVVHFANNVFKLGLVGRQVDWKIAVRFGVPAVIAAMIGAALLVYLVQLPTVGEYSIGSRNYSINAGKLVVAMMLAGFAVLDLVPKFQNLQIDPRYLPVGGILSGFFGGLSGHQGALRSAFMIRLGLSKEAFIGTGVVIACAIDVTRLSLYAQRIGTAGAALNWSLVGWACIAAFLGAYAGSKLIKKVTIEAVQRLVAVMLLTIAVLLGGGII